MSGVLLGLIALCYVAPAIFQSFGGDPTWFFYVARGVMGMAVFAILGWNRPRIVGVVCFFGAICESLSSICGMAYWARPITMKPWENLCDASTGLPITPIFLLGFAVCAALIAQERQK